MLNPKAVMGEDFPGETFRVLQEKEMRTYREFRTERLVLEAYDKLRPLWNMPSHLQKLHELWEHHQQDLSKVEAEPTKTKTNYKTKASKSNRVSEDNGYFSGRLFDEPNLFNQGDE